MAIDTKGRSRAFAAAAHETSSKHDRFLRDPFPAKLRLDLPCPLLDEPPERREALEPLAPKPSLHYEMHAQP